MGEAGVLNMKEFDGIVGRTLTAIRLDVAQEHLTLEFAAGEAVGFAVEADCCSETWFADIVNPELVLGQEITRCGEIELPAEPARLLDERRTRQECDQFYGFELVSAKGVCIVAYRNSSNGYYGGSIMRSEPRTGGKLITADYSA